MDELAYFFLIAVMVGLGIYVVSKTIKFFGSIKTIVPDHHVGLLWLDGKFSRKLNPGGHYLWTLKQKRVELFDLRQQILEVVGQELLSADNIGLKISVTGTFEVADPMKAVGEVSNWRQSLHNDVQIALRDQLTPLEMDVILENRAELGGKALEAVKDKLAVYGITLKELNVRDIMFPGEIKGIYAQVVRARKQGQAALERARGEQASLRSLANAARMIEKNPALWNLRTLHALDEGKNQTVILNTNGSPLETTEIAAQNDDSPKAN